MAEIWTSVDVFEANSGGLVLGTEECRSPLVPEDMRSRVVGQDRACGAKATARAAAP